MIEFRNINKSFHLKNKKEVEVLKNFNLFVKKQEIIILKGVSGCGKSTILNLCSALQKPSSGEIFIKEENITKLSDSYASSFRLKNIGFIFQKHNLLPDQSVLQNLAIPLLVSKLSLKEIQEKAEVLLKEFKLIELKDELVQNLSGGEAARVAIIRALMNDPAIILADEPSANLDVSLSKTFIKHMHYLQKKGKTIIIATHDDIFLKECKYSKVIYLEKKV